MGFVSSELGELEVDGCPSGAVDEARFPRLIKRVSNLAGPCCALSTASSESTRFLRTNFYTFEINKMGADEFPEVEGGGSLILAWQIRNKRVLVVGGGEACLHSMTNY
jgi:hypothetical protein